MLVCMCACVYEITSLSPDQGVPWRVLTPVTLPGRPMVVRLPNLSCLGQEGMAELADSNDWLLSSPNSRPG